MKVKFTQYHEADTGLAGGASAEPMPSINDPMAVAAWIEKQEQALAQTQAVAPAPVAAPAQTVSTEQKPADAPATPAAPEAPAAPVANEQKPAAQAAPVAEADIDDKAIDQLFGIGEQKAEEQPRIKDPVLASLIASGSEEDIANYIQWKKSSGQPVSTQDKQVAVQAIEQKQPEATVPTAEPTEDQVRIESEWKAFYTEAYRRQAELLQAGLLYAPPGQVLTQHMVNQQIAALYQGQVPLEKPTQDTDEIEELRMANRNAARLQALDRLRYPAQLAAERQLDQFRRDKAKREFDALLAKRNEEQKARQTEAERAAKNQELFVDVFGKLAMDRGIVSNPEEPITDDLVKLANETYAATMKLMANPAMAQTPPDAIVNLALRSVVKNHKWAISKMQNAKKELDKATVVPSNANAAQPVAGAPKTWGPQGGTSASPTSVGNGQQKAFTGFNDLTKEAMSFLGK